MEEATEKNLKMECLEAKRPRPVNIVNCLVPLFLFATVLDGITTYWIFVRLGTAAELHPLIRFVAESVSSAGLGAFLGKSGQVVGLGLLYFLVPRRAFVMVLAASTVFYLMGAYINIINLLH